MKDEEFNENLEEIERLIEKLGEGDVSLKEGKKLKRKAEELLEKNKKLLKVGEGKVNIIERETGETVEKPLDLKEK